MSLSNTKQNVMLSKQSLVLEWSQKIQNNRQNVYYASGLVSLQVGGPIRMSVVYWK